MFMIELVLWHLFMFCVISTLSCKLYLQISETMIFRPFLERDHLEFSGRALHVRDARGSPVFSASRDEVRVYSDALAVDAPGGINVRSAVQVPVVRAPPAFDLQ